MKRWIGALVPANRKPEPVEPPPPPMAGPSGHPAGIDHLMANARPADETADSTETKDAYGSLMPVRRLGDHTTALLEAPAAPDSATDSPTGEALAAESPAAGQDVSESTDPPATPESAAPPPPPAPPIKAPPATWQTLHALARMGYEQRDFEAAAGWWRLMRLGFPTIFHGYADAAMALMELGRFDEGRTLLMDAGPRFPNEPGIPATRAQLEAHAGDWAASIEAWRAAIDFPASPWWACLRLAEALEQHGSAEEADAVLRQGCRDARFRSPAVCAKAIAVALRRQDWPELAERLGFLDVCGNDEILGLDFDAILLPLRDADPAAFAVAIQAPWVGRAIDAAQTDPHRLLRQARLAQLAGRLADAMARLATLRPAMPQTADAYLRLEAILRDSGHPDTAETALAEAAARLPPDERIWTRIGAAREARGDWTGAVAYWTEMARVLPASAVAADRLREARMRLDALTQPPVGATLTESEAVVP
jgi:tetratricopeptide (TPR) repeat protein